MNAYGEFLNVPSMESRYLRLIILLDQAESIGGDLTSDEYMDPDLMQNLSQIKQNMIEEFARLNEKITLNGYKKQSKDEEESMEDDGE